MEHQQLGFDKKLFRKKGTKRNNRVVKIHLYFKKLKRKWVIFSLGALCFTLFISHTLYVIDTHQFPTGGLDEPVYLSMALNSYDALKEPSFESISKIVSFAPGRQPLYGVFLAIPLLLFGTSHAYKISLWVNIIFYLTTVVATYFLGREFLSKKASFLAAFIFAFYGFPLFYLHFAYTETMATGLITLAFLFLIRSDYYRNTRSVLLFSIFFGLSFLTRWTMPVFIFGSALLLLIQGIFQKKYNSKISRFTLLKNISTTLLVLLLFSFMYYIPNYKEFMFYLVSGAQHGKDWVSDSLQNPFSFHSAIWYLTSLAQLTIFFYALFLSGFFLAIFRLKKYAIFIISFIIPFIFFTFFTTFKDDRFIVPIYPMIALISATVFDYVKNKRINTFLVIITLFIGSLNFLGASWAIGPMKFSVSGGNFTLPNSILLPMPIGHPRRVWLAPISWPPRPEESNAYQIVKVLQDDWGKQEKPFRLLQTFEMTQLGDGLSTIFTYEQRGMVVGSGSIVGIPKDSYDIFFQRIKDTDYILIKNGIIDRGNVEGTSIEWDNFIYFVRKFNKVMQFSDGRLPEAFVKVAVIPIPFDKSTLTVYRKKREITKDEWLKFAQVFIRLDPQMGSKIMEVAEKIEK